MHGASSSVIEKGILCSPSDEYCPGGSKTTGGPKPAFIVPVPPTRWQISSEVKDSSGPSGVSTTKPVTVELWSTTGCGVPSSKRTSSGASTSILTFIRGRCDAEKRPITAQELVWRPKHLRIVACHRLGSLHTPDSKNVSLSRTSPGRASRACTTTTSKRATHKPRTNTQHQTSIERKKKIHPHKQHQRVTKACSACVRAVPLKCVSSPAAPLLSAPPTNRPRCTHSNIKP